MKPIKTYKRLELKSDIPWDKLSEFSEGVIAPLVRTSDKVKLFIRVQANSKEGIDENTLKIPIKETLNQINAENIKLETSEN